MIEISVSSKGGNLLEGKNSVGQITKFDAPMTPGGESSAPTPMETMLESLAACTSLDILTILKKKRKTVNDLIVHASGDRSDKHPKVYTKVHLIYELHSPDAELSELNRAIELSESTYCCVMGLFKKAGVEFSFESKLIK